MVTISSKRSGLTVNMSDEQYAVQSTKYGSSAREQILNTAGRVLTHRKTLEKIMCQTITEDQKNQVESLARAYAMKNILDQKIIEMGYSSYLDRADSGRIMPESWDRICDRARNACKHELDFAEAQSWDRERAMAELGLYTDRDSEWSHRVSDWCDWEITAPEGWGEPKN